MKFKGTIFIKISITFLLISALLLLILPACQKGTGGLQKITVVLDWVPNTNHTGIYIAKENGYYNDQGLEVEIIQPSEGGSADLIAAGKGEFGISYQEQVTYARTAENPLPVVAIAAIIQHNTSGFASLLDKGILILPGSSMAGMGSRQSLKTSTSISCCSRKWTRSLTSIHL